MQAILSSIIGVLGAVFLFGFAVFIHELGHFLVAKWAGVGVSKFAIGFGPKIFSWVRGETEYSVRWIPVGGFVALKGMVEDVPESSDEDATDGETKEKGSITEDLDALRSRSPLVRIAVFAAGVTCNYLVAIILMVVLLMVGGPAPVDLPNVVEEIPQDTRLHELGWRSGDQILSVRREPMSALRPLLSRAPVQTLQGDEQALFETWSDVYEGMSECRPEQPRFVTLQWLQGKLGLADAPTTETCDLLFTVQRDGQNLRLPIPPEVYANPEEMQHFMPPQPAYVGAVEPGSPAHKARLIDTDYTLGEFRSSLPQWKEMPLEPIQQEDSIISVKGEPVSTWNQMRKILRANPEELITIGVQRLVNDAKRQLLLMVHLESDPSDPNTGRLGIIAGLPAQGKSDGLGLFQALALAPVRTLELTDMIIYQTASVFQRSGREIRRNLGGPVAIGIMAYKQAQRGLSDYLRLFIVISIILAVMNLLPIPILDGGYIVITIIEAVIGRPLPRKVLEPVLGLFFILFILLFLFLFYNDLMNWVYGFSRQ